MKNVLFAIMAIIMSMALGFKTANAKPLTFNYSDAFGSGSFGTVDIEVQGLTLKFTVSADDSFFNSNSGPGLTWDKFYFNSNLNLTTANISMLSAPGNWGLNFDNNVSIFDLFDYEVKGTGMGSNSYNPFEVILEVSGTGLSIDDVALNNIDGWMFAGHLRGFDAIEGQTSTFLAVGNPNKPVPEPTTMLLLGIGLTGLAGIRLRRKKI